MTNKAAVQRTLRALKPVLGPEHAGLVEAARILATAVDDAPGNAALWREYRATLADLAQLGADAGSNDDAQWLESVTRLRPAVGDGTKS